jgi:hypothetical protein
VFDQICAGTDFVRQIAVKVIQRRQSVGDSSAWLLTGSLEGRLERSENDLIDASVHELD